MTSRTGLLLELTGCALIVAGALLLATWLGLIVAGVIMVGLAIAMERAE